MSEDPIQNWAKLGFLIIRAIGEFDQCLDARMISHSMGLGEIRMELCILICSQGEDAMPTVLDHMDLLW